MGRLLRHRWSPLWLVVPVAASAVAGTGCGPTAEQLELPPIPVELQSVAAEYDQPTGTVPDDAVAQIDEVEQKIAVLGQTRLGELVSDLLTALRERVVASGLGADPAAPPPADRPIIDATARLEHVCRGWDDASTTPDTANGTVELFASIDSSQLNRNIYGTATGCRSRREVGGVTVHPFVDGDIAIYLYGPLPSDVMSARFLVAFDGTLGTERASQAAVSFDFRFLYPQLEVRVAVPDGHVIGSVGPNEISLRGKNGTFGCSRETRACGALP